MVVRQTAPQRVPRPSLTNMPFPTSVWEVLPLKALTKCKSVLECLDSRCFLAENVGEQMYGDQTTISKEQEAVDMTRHRRSIENEGDR